MYQDYKDLLSAFHAHGVRYLIVGGYAVIFHAQPRFTKDIDLFIKADLANAQATYAALASFGAGRGEYRSLADRVQNEISCHDRRIPPGESLRAMWGHRFACHRTRGSGWSSPGRRRSSYW